jgi:hypothetical protein
MRAGAWERLLAIEALTVVVGAMSALAVLPALACRRLDLLLCVRDCSCVLMSHWQSTLRALELEGIAIVHSTGECSSCGFSPVVGTSANPAAQAPRPLLLVD